MLSFILMMCVKKKMIIIDLNRNAATIIFDIEKEKEESNEYTK